MMVNEGVENNIRQEHPDDIDPHEHLECVPFVGKEFMSKDDAKAFYNNFAYRRGFSIRKGGHYISCKKEEATMVRFVCSSEGGPKKPDNQTTPQKDKPHTRTGCKARLKIRLQDGIWKVSVFEDDHNHPLITSPSKKRSLRSHKEMGHEDRQYIRDMHAQNIEPTKIHHFLGARHGGTKNLKSKKKDMSNLIAAENRRFVGMDVEATPSNGVLDPPISQCKGKRKQPQRLKPPSEAKKPRKCGVCGSKKGGHNARTCSMKKMKRKDMEHDYADSGTEEEYEDLSS
ncbi:hypothetical protein LUZ61_009102 [Rhynchospora tenuis]|uniref:FAR1 domain-containing protein n=1 Tax=Rhynchospora tenuis TaxID=198213 RepID=A0AAD5ZWS1_9POAL|nr:hypothetical protein LUZ61_009102 [Rhynchospora tenuis]